MFSKDLLAGRVALVTGSTSGIGRGILEELLKVGVKAAVMHGLGDPKVIEADRAALEAKYGIPVTFDGADVTDEAALNKMVADIVAKHGSLDILVNNAGIQHVAPTKDFPLDKYDLIHKINVRAPFILTKAALKVMEKTGWGRIINIASAHGLVGSPGKYPYVEGKHGMVGGTKVVGLEWAESKITCNAIAPGWVKTPLVDVQIAAIAKQKNLSLADAEKDLLAEKEPSKRFTTPEQIGQQVIFFCSPACDNVTGITFSADGGWVAH